jgi:hypothetical protein
MLSAGLAVLAISSLSVPPARMKGALLAEFRRSKQVVPIRRPLIQWVAIVAVAAAILLAVFLSTKAPQPRTVSSHPPRVQAPMSANAPANAPAPAPLPVAAPPVTAKVSRPVKRRGVVKPQPPPVVQAHAQDVAAADPAEADAAPEVATDFFEIPYTEPLRPFERADVFRMQMPRANMAAFGLPVTGGRLDTRVTADVLMGEDGVARAIRFIR